MENNMNYEQLADNLCEIHFLYSRDLANVFEQRSTRGEEAAESRISWAVWSGRN